MPAEHGELDARPPARPQRRSLEHAQPAVLRRAPRPRVARARRPPPRRRRPQLLAQPSRRHVGVDGAARDRPAARPRRDRRDLDGRVRSAAPRRARVASAPSAATRPRSGSAERTAPPARSTTPRTTRATTSSTTRRTTRRRSGSTSALRIRSTTRPSTTRTRSTRSCTSGRAGTTAATGTRTCASTLRSMPGTAPDPKIELHVHLEGTVRPDTLRAIAKRNDYALPDDLESLYRFRDFAHFIEVWILTTNALRTSRRLPPDGRRLRRRGGVARRRLPRGDLQPGRARRARRRLGRDLQRLLRRRRGGARAARRRDPAHARHPARLHAGGGASTVECATRRKYRDRGVVGVGLGGLEAEFPPEPYEPAFALARVARPRLGAARRRGGRRRVGARRARGPRRRPAPARHPRGRGSGLVARARRPRHRPRRLPALEPPHRRRRLARRAPAAAARRRRRALLDLDRRPGDVRHRPRRATTRPPPRSASSPRAAYEAGVAGALCDEATRERLAADRRVYDWPDPR